MSAPVYLKFFQLLLLLLEEFYLKPRAFHSQKSCDFYFTICIVLYLKRKKKKLVGKLTGNLSSFSWTSPWASVCYMEADLLTTRQVTLDRSLSFQPRFPPSGKRMSVVEDGQADVWWKSP